MIRNVIFRDYVSVEDQRAVMSFIIKKQGSCPGWWTDGLWAAYEKFGWER